MRRSSARTPLALGATVVVEVAIAALSVCADQAVPAVESMVSIGGIAYVLVWLVVLGHRFLGRRTAPDTTEPEPLAWRRPWVTALIGAAVTMGIIAALSLEVLLTQPGRCR